MSIQVAYIIIRLRPFKAILINFHLVDCMDNLRVTHYFLWWNWRFRLI